MKKFYLLILAPLFLASCSKALPETFVERDFPAPNVSSADGGMHLSIPEDALPEGLTLSDIRMEKEAEQDGIITYRMEPDGTMFRSPITVTVGLPGFTEGDRIFLPLLSNVTPQGEEFLSDVVVSLDPETGHISASGEISHFSMLKIKRDAMMEIKLTSPGGKFTVGSKVPVKGSIARWRKDSNLSNFRVRVFAREVPDETILSPAGLLKIISSRQALSEGETLEFSSGKWVCDKEGETNIKVMLPTQWEVDDANHFEILYQFHIYSDIVECVTPEDGGGSNAMYKLSFDHVKPGEYSEVYLYVSGLAAGEKYTVTLSGPSVDEPVVKEMTADKDGYGRLTWKIFSYGKYSAKISGAGLEAQTDIQVN